MDSSARTSSRRPSSGKRDRSSSCICLSVLAAGRLPAESAIPGCQTAPAAWRAPTTLDARLLVGRDEPEQQRSGIGFLRAGKVRFADVSVIKMEWDSFASVETYLPGGAHRDLAKSLSNLRTMHVHFC